MEAGEKELEYLAALLSSLCSGAGKSGKCNLFSKCPAWRYGWTCGNVTKNEWIMAAKELSYPIGLSLNRIFEQYSDPNHFQAGRYIHIFRSVWTAHDSNICFQIGNREVRLFVNSPLGMMPYCPSVEDMLANDWCIRGFTDD